MIHKQQTGHSVEDIINGLCEALVRNYLNNLAKGKDIEEPIVFAFSVRNFFGFDNIHNDFRARSIECNGCSLGRPMRKM